MDDTRAEFHHTLGMIYRRLNRYQEASAALQRYVDLLPSVRRSQRAEWTRAEIRFLRSFGDRMPLELEGDPDAVHTIPFRLVNDKIVVRARINGDDPFDLVIDTGAEQMVLSKETAQEVRVRPIVNNHQRGRRRRRAPGSRSRACRFTRGRVALDAQPPGDYQEPTADRSSQKARTRQPLTTGLGSICGDRLQEPPPDSGAPPC